MITFMKTLLIVSLSVIFMMCGDLESETAKTFAFAAFMLTTTLVICAGNKKTGAEHMKATAGAEKE